MSTERLQKILARGGFSSRRAAEKIISEGRVRVNGHVVTELGSKADPYKDKVEVNGVRVVAERAVYVVLHKPRGVVTTMSDPEGRPSVKEILAPIGTRVYPVGRLDFATSGVLLATNDGDFAEGMMHPKKAVPKTYVVKVAGVMQPKDMDRWREGIRLEDGVTLAAKLKFLRHEADKTWFELTIREGRNQQIRRMGEASGFPVMRLARLSFAGVTAEGLRPGEWRYLAPDELVDLKKEYGVPRKIVDAEMRPTARTRPQKVTTVKPGVPAGTRGRARTAPKPEGAEGASEWPRGRRRSGPSAEGSDRGGERGPREGARGRGRSAPTGDDSRSISRAPDGPRGRGRSAPEGSRGDSPRFGGGGAPARGRQPGAREGGRDVSKDWGAGAGRGRVESDRGGRSEPDHAAPRRGPPSNADRSGGGFAGKRSDRSGPPRAGDAGGDRGGRNGPSRPSPRPAARPGPRSSPSGGGGRPRSR